MFPDLAGRTLPFDCVSFGYFISPVPGAHDMGRDLSFNVGGTPWFLTSSRIPPPPVVHAQHPLPPFTAETALQKTKAAEAAWNTRDPAAVAKAYSPDTVWRNRNEIFIGNTVFLQSYIPCSVEFIVDSRLAVPELCSLMLRQYIS